MVFLTGSAEDCIPEFCAGGATGGLAEPSEDFGDAAVVPPEGVIGIISYGVVIECFR